MCHCVCHSSDLIGLVESTELVVDSSTSTSSSLTKSPHLVHYEQYESSTIAILLTVTILATVITCIVVCIVAWIMRSRRRTPSCGHQYALGEY